MLLHRVLQPRHVDVWCVAGAFLLPSLADEVEVGGAVPVGGLLHDHALGEAAGVAGPAEQRALEVVVVDAPVLLGGCPHLDDVLHLLEEFLADKGLVASGDLVALESDHANVVAVAQQVGEPRDGDGLGRSPGCGTCAQSAVVQLFG
nr:hypothetical protein [Actinomadura soli]